MFDSLTYRNSTYALGQGPTYSGTCVRNFTIWLTTINAFAISDTSLTSSTQADHVYITLPLNLQPHILLIQQTDTADYKYFQPVYLGYGVNGINTISIEYGSSTGLLDLKTIAVTSITQYIINMTVIGS